MSQRSKIRKLDLHGVFHSQDFDMVDPFIGECLIDNVSSFEIITGYSKRMKEIVQDVLSDYNLKGVEPPFNSGTLIIKT